MRYSRVVLKRVLAFCALLSACAPPKDEREARVANVLSRADEVLIRTRPELMAGKYRRMATNAFDFYRGALPLAVADWEAGRISPSGFTNATLPVNGLGDPHPENFGLLLGRDGVFNFEPNDFDAASRVPYLFDVRRLVVGLGVGARQRNPDVHVAAIGRAAAQAYADAMLSGDAGVIDAPGDSEVLQDLWERGTEDLADRKELNELTRLDGGARHFIRDPPDPGEPGSLLADVPVGLELNPVVARLESPVLDTVRQFGSGVASWPRLRFLVLLDGPTSARDDDVIVEVKELAEAPSAAWYRPYAVALDTPSRIETSIRRAWWRPDADPRWYTTGWNGLPVQVRTESEANKGVNVSKWSGVRASETELAKLGAVLGTLLARVHLRSEPEVIASIRAQLGRGPDVFALEQSNFADAESAQVFADFTRFRHALDELGPTLGIMQDPRELPQGFQREVFGGPP